ncbi:hypothetical protein GJ496_011186 [Pomphorhynchus laevis]|nr:hypothetical protein GJ496_011186 [Pomphorhynchus laevis]
MFPRHMAANKWDNVGLLIGDYSACVKRILVTNDFTRSILKELQPHDFVLSYHPPIFRSIKRLIYDEWKSEIIMKCAKHDIAVYSPHTSVDAIFGGVNDWLCSQFVSVRRVAPIPIEKIEDTRKINPNAYCTIMEDYSDVTDRLMDQISSSVTLVLKMNNLLWIEHENNRITVDNDWIDKTKIISTKPKIDSVGYGRFMENIEALTVRDVFNRVKSLLGIDTARIAFAEEKDIDSVVHDIASKHRVLITGELSHHQILDCIHNGHTIALMLASHYPNTLQISLETLYTHPLSLPNFYTFNIPSSIGNRTRPIGGVVLAVNPSFSN